MTYHNHLGFVMPTERGNPGTPRPLLPEVGAPQSTPTPGSYSIGRPLMTTAGNDPATAATRNKISSIAVQAAPSTVVVPSAPGQFLARAMTEAARTIGDRGLAAKLNGMALGVARFRDQSQIDAALNVIEAPALAAILTAAQGLAAASTTIRPAPTTTVTGRSGMTTSTTLAPPRVTGATSVSASTKPLRPTYTLPSSEPAPMPSIIDMMRHADSKPSTAPTVYDAPTSKPSEPYKPEGSIVPMETPSAVNPATDEPLDWSTSVPNVETSDALAPPMTTPSAANMLPPLISTNENNGMKILGVPWYFVAGGAAAVVVGGYFVMRRRSPTPNRRRRRSRR